MAAAKDAGVTAIDHLITTHYHGDHIGGLAELASRIPIKEFRGSKVREWLYFPTCFSSLAPLRRRT